MLRYNVLTIIHQYATKFEISGPVDLKCRRIMTEAGLSESFPQGVAQSIQSITVEDIRKYFEQNVTGENGIPTGRFPMPYASNYRFGLTVGALIVSLKISGSAKKTLGK